MKDQAGSRGSLNRRDLLKRVGAAGLTTGFGPLLHAVATRARAGEQGKPVIEGYASPISVAAGEEVAFHVSTVVKQYSIEVRRLGAEREVVWTKDGLPGERHPVPGNASTHGCNWPAALSLHVPENWRSGYYSVILRGTDAGGAAAKGELYFVVRPAQPGRDARILLQLCTNTYNAYNNWAGTSLYGGPRGQGRRVSFERPYAGFAEGDKFTSLYSGWRNWEEPFVQWAEAAGYKLDYAANADLEFHPEILKHYRLVLSVGHDEYWSAPMRDHLEAFIAAGGNVAFFSGNTCFWQVRSEDGGRALVSWKQAFKEDPLYPAGSHKLLSTMWSNRLIERPENQLTGVSFAWGGYHRFFEQFQDGAGAYTMHRPDHWIFEGTGLKRGDLLGSKDKVVGYECDGCEFVMKAGLPIPTHRDGTPESFEILGTCPAGLSKSDNSIGWVTTALYGDEPGKQHAQPGAAILGCYTGLTPSPLVGEGWGGGGGTVVTTGCTDWPKGLRGRDPLVERITRNVLERLSG